MGTAVDVFCIHIKEHVSDMYGYSESREGYLSLLEDDMFSMSPNVEDEEVVKTFSKSKINEWVVKCKKFIDDSELNNSDGNKHTVILTLKKTKVPYKVIHKQLRKDKIV